MSQRTKDLLLGISIVLGTCIGFFISGVPPLAVYIGGSTNIGIGLIAYVSA